MIDLYTHTKYSVGSYTVLKILKSAEEINLSLLLITAYNTVDDYDGILDSNLKNIYSDDIIPRFEITTTYN